jgi:uncharacterized protein YggE
MRLIHTTRTLAAVLLFSATRLSAQQPNPVPIGPILSTSGQGEAKITPDRASVSVNVQTRGSTAAAAAAENATRTKAVFDAMARIGLPKDQVTTEGYTVYPEMQYNRDGGAPRVSGYVATNTVRVESKRTDQVGTIIDAAIGAGANLINGVTFYAESIDSARRQAIASAVASARADAEAMARAAGGSVGELLELSTGGPTIPPRPMFDMMAKRTMAAAEATPVNPGQQTVTVFVTARWKFLPTR